MIPFFFSILIFHPLWKRPTLQTRLSRNLWVDTSRRPFWRSAPRTEVYPEVGVPMAFDGLFCDCISCSRDVPDFLGGD
jgi:hypothetical protein